MDRYAQYLTVQLTSLAFERRSPWLLDVLEELLRSVAIVLRTEKGALEEEGLRLQDSVVRGHGPDGPIEIREDVLAFGVALQTGQKTGFYLDHRVNRARAASYARGRSVADVCCYSGAFGVAALRAGAARTVGVDVSQGALEPGGILVTCSCSGRVGLGDFLGAAGRAAADQGLAVRVLERLGQGPDHPVSATCAETEYPNA